MKNQQSKKAKDAKGSRRLDDLTVDRSHSQRICCCCVMVLLSLAHFQKERENRPRAFKRARALAGV